MVQSPTELNFERQEVIDWLIAHNYPALPVAPAQPAEKYPLLNKTTRQPELDKDGNPKPRFMGKNPSYLDEDGIPHLISHTNYQSQLPSADDLKKWFANPANGVGTLGGWNNTIWLDLDLKQFASKEECDRASGAILDTHPELAKTFLEESHSGGWRIGVKVKQKPDFTNFALTPGGSHVGEALFEGRFTVLAPTIGPSGNPYRSINRTLPVEVESLESIGIYSTKGGRKREVGRMKDEKTLHTSTCTLQPSIGSIPLEMLGTDTSREILRGCETEDRSKALATAAQEWYGWQNWARDNGIAVSGIPFDLIHYAGVQLGIDSDRIDRIIKSIDPANCQPAALYRGSEANCWLKIRKLDRSLFEEKCPPEIYTQIENRQASGGSSGGNKKPSSRSNNSTGQGGGIGNGSGSSGGGAGSNVKFDQFDSNPQRNNWRAPIKLNGEIGWFVEGKKGDKVFIPKCNFDFQIEQELSSVDGVDGGGIVLQVKRSIDSEQKRAIIKSVDYGSARDFEAALKKALGEGVVVNLRSDELKSLIHVRLLEYRSRGGRKYRLCDRIGQQEDGTWVFEDKQFTKDGQPTTQEESGWVYNPQVSPTDTFASPQILDENPKALRNLIEAQKKVMGSNFMRVLLCDGYVAACLNEQRIVTTEGFMLILNLYGDPGGLKTFGMESALSLAWGISDKLGMCSASESYLYERLSRYGSIPTLWDDPPSKRREDKEKLDELIKRNYGKFSRNVRGSAQQPHSSFIPTTNHNCGDTLPAAKSRTINVFFPVTGDLDFSYQAELEDAKCQATGAFSQIISIGYDRTQVREVRARLQKYLPTAHDRASLHLAILTWYTQKVVDLAGMGIDVEAWVIQNLCPDLNEAQTGLNSVADFVERFIAAKSNSAIGAWNSGVVNSPEQGKCLALHMPSIWTAIESGDPPPYNRSILERVLVEKGCLKNKPAKLDRDRDSTFAYQREIHKGRNEGEGWVPPSKPKPVNKKCLLIPEKLWSDLGFLLLVSDSPPDDGGGGGGNLLVTSGNLKVTSGNLEEVTSLNPDESMVSSPSSSSGNLVTKKEREEFFLEAEYRKEKELWDDSFSSASSCEENFSAPTQNLVTRLPELDLSPETLENQGIELVTNEGYFEVTKEQKEVTGRLPEVTKREDEVTTPDELVTNEGYWEDEVTAGSENDMSLENLQAIAADLADESLCPNKEVLAELRVCWSADILNAACKLLSSERHAQIKNWVAELNQPTKTPKLGSRIKYGDFTGKLAASAPNSIWYVEWDKIPESYRKIRERMGDPIPELPIKLTSGEFELIDR
jgi:hypothetical protein